MGRIIDLQVATIFLPLSYMLVVLPYWNNGVLTGYAVLLNIKMHECNFKSCLQIKIGNSLSIFTYSYNKSNREN